MNNYQELQRDLTDIKNKVLELDDLLIELKRYMLDTLIIDNKVLDNDLYKELLNNNDDVIDNLNDAINKAYSNL